MEHPKRMTGWVGVYDPWNGRPLVTVTSWDQEFADLPDDGLQGFIKFFEDGTRAFVTGYDWYFWVNHPSGVGILSANNDDPEETRSRYPGAVLKRGKHTTDEWIHQLDNLLAQSPNPGGCKGC